MADAEKISIGDINDVIHSAGYIRQEKGYNGKRPQTLVHLTDEGRTAWIDYLNAMKALLGN